MKKLNIWVRYLAYIFIILVLTYSAQQVFQSIKKGEPTIVYTLTFYSILLYAPVGMVLGLEHLILELKKKGTWSINLPKVILFGIPSLYFSLTYILYYSNINQNVSILRFLLYPIDLMMTTKANFIIVFQIIFGYTIITSLDKVQEK